MNSVAGEHRWHPIEIPDYGPRSVQLRTWYRIGLTLLQLICVLAPLYSIWFGGKDVARMDRLRTEGRIIPARVVEKTVYHGKGSTYRIRYSFVLPLSVVQDKETVHRAIYDSVFEGQTVVATIIESDPSIHAFGVVNMERVGEIRNQWLLGTFFFVFIAGIFLVSVMTIVRKETAYLTNYVAVPAIVDSIGPRIGMRYPKNDVTVRYHSPAGKDQQVVIRLDSKIAGELVVNSPTTALVNPNNYLEVVLLKSIVSVQLSPS
jgi:hypothetical protein